MSRSVNAHRSGVQVGERAPFARCARCTPHFPLRAAPSLRVGPSLRAAPSLEPLTPSPDSSCRRTFPATVPVGTAARFRHNQRVHLNSRTLVRWLRTLGQGLNISALEKSALDILGRNTSVTPGPLGTMDPRSRLCPVMCEAEAVRARRVALIGDLVQCGEYQVAAPQIVQALWEDVRHLASGST